jgi:hypothetical protein
MVVSVVVVIALVVVEVAVFILGNSSGYSIFLL